MLLTNRGIPHIADAHSVAGRVIGRIVEGEARDAAELLAYATAGAEPARQEAFLAAAVDHLSVVAGLVDIDDPHVIVGDTPDAEVLARLLAADVHGDGNTAGQIAGELLDTPWGAYDTVLRYLLRAGELAVEGARRLGVPVGVVIEGLIDSPIGDMAAQAQAELPTPAWSWRGVTIPVTAQVATDAWEAFGVRPTAGQLLPALLVAVADAYEHGPVRAAEGFDAVIASFLEHLADGSVPVSERARLGSCLPAVILGAVAALPVTDAELDGLMMTAYAFVDTLPRREVRAALPDVLELVRVDAAAPGWSAQHDPYAAMHAAVAILGAAAATLSGGLQAVLEAVAAAAEAADQLPVEVRSEGRYVIAGRLPGADRNKPCPCNSGQKIKRCCGV